MNDPKYRHNFIKKRSLLWAPEILQKGYLGHYVNHSGYLGHYVNEFSDDNLTSALAMEIQSNPFTRLRKTNHSKEAADREMKRLHDVQRYLRVPKAKLI